VTALHPTQLILALLEGLGLIASPCILPILPIMLAASLDGGKARPLGIITGFIGAFTFFALLSRQILAWLNVDPEIVRNAALGLLILFGLVMLSKTLSDKLLGVTQGLANFGQNISSRWDQKNGYFSGVAIGALIGLIWTPCAGPILAAAVVQIIQAKTNVEAALTIVMFALGAGLPMLLIALLGRKIMGRLTFLKTHSYAVRRVLGVIIMAAAALIYSGADVQLLAASGGSALSVGSGGLEGALEHPYPAPEIVGIQEWINSKPLKIADLRGKVVLIDFWTYSCINCVRTLPAITKWDAKYRDKGLIIIGVHSPEFEFEKKLANVKAATEKYGIHYPVALDSNLRTFANFNNQYWPAHYLIDKSGNVVYTHFGEGDYDVTENNIRTLLGVGPETAPIEAPAESSSSSFMQTPETYLGYARAQSFAGHEAAADDQSSSYSFPSTLLLNQWALDGEWLIGAEYIVAQKPEAKLRLDFIARKVFLVLGTQDGKPIAVHVLLNGKPVDKEAGADVKYGVLTVDHQGLYELIDQGATKNGILELESDAPGLQAYAFTFGG
jgi:cytochrome c biogenesis protein CcdA/thiol-disulfide isomerase/thioredoxin